MPAPAGPFALLASHADLRRLVLGTFATHAGQWALNLGLGWLMLEMTDSAFQVGLLSFAGGVPMLLVFPYLHLLPVFARDVLAVGSDGLAVLMAVSGAGALTGGLLNARVAASARPGRSMLVLIIAYGGLVTCFANATTLWTALLVMVPGSVCAALYMSLNATLLQMQLDESMRGRVTGIHQLTYALFLVGALPMGVLADLLGAPLAVTTGALLSSAVVLLIGLRSRQLWSLGGVVRER